MHPSQLFSPPPSFFFFTLALLYPSRLKIGLVFWRVNVKDPRHEIGLTWAVHLGPRSKIGSVPLSASHAPPLNAFVEFNTRRPDVRATSEKSMGTGWDKVRTHCAHSALPREKSPLRQHWPLPTRFYPIRYVPHPTFGTRTTDATFCPRPAHHPAHRHCPLYIPPLLSHPISLTRLQQLHYRRLPPPLAPCLQSEERYFIVVVNFDSTRRNS